MMESVSWLQLLGAGGAVGLIVALHKLGVALFGSYKERGEQLELAKSNEFTRLKELLDILRQEVEQLKRVEKELYLRTIESETRAARLELELERMRHIQETLESEISSMRTALERHTRNGGAENE